MSGFTKGPWQIDANNVHAGTVATVHHCTDGWADIWSDKWMEEGMGPEVMDANARLIAASPTMYESLVKVEELLSFHEGSAKPEFDGAHPTVRINGEDFAILLADIRAALSKAAGEGR